MPKLGATCGGDNTARLWRLWANDALGNGVHVLQAGWHGGSCLKWRAAASQCALLAGLQQAAFCGDLLTEVVGRMLGCLEVAAGGAGCSSTALQRWL
jgi:hypothetical protein